jgi:glycosyltransferase involved in cell wall biosynthesis
VRVAITLEQLWHRVPGGTAIAATELIEELRQRDDIEVTVVTAWHRPSTRPRLAGVSWRNIAMPRPALYESWLRWRRPRVSHVDLVHATTLIPPATTKPMVATVHDLAVLHDPSHFTARGVRTMTRGVEILRDEAAVVLCSSLVTLEDCASFGFDRNRLRHVPLGVRPVVVNTEAVAAMKARLGLQRPYVLAVGTIEPRKNLVRLAAAFAMLPDHYDLVVVGPTGWGDQNVPGGAAAARTRMIGYVDTTTLWALYSGAAVFCYPSLREGFGLPVVEAMAAGTPVVTSRGTSTEEVAGGAAVLVDPLDVDDIAAGMWRALDSREDLIARGRAVAGAATWARTADLTVAAYREALC